MAPEADDTLKTKFSKDEEEKLRHLCDLLHLFHHRNNNQHRRSVWWRHFSIFRRQLNALLVDVAWLNEVPTTHVARSRKKAREPYIRQQLQQRLRFWQDTLVSRWQRAFSQVAADGRFAVLGLVLSAVLAEVSHMTGVTAVLEDLGQAEVEDVLHTFANEGWDEDGRIAVSHVQDQEDLGQAVERDSPSLGGVGTVAQDRDESQDKLSPLTTAAMSISTNHTDRPLPVPKPVKKKRRKGNAIDDLFGGLN